MSANSKTGGAPIFYCPICPMLPGWLVEQDRDAHMAEKHPEQTTVTGSGVVVRPIPEPAWATEAECEQLRAENAALRKQARESAYKEAQMRGIVDAAEKLLCGLYEHILPLSVHTREVMRDLRNALGDERGDSSHDRPKYEPIVRGGVKGE